MPRRISRTMIWTRRVDVGSVVSEYDCEITYTIEGRDRPAYFSKSFGNWLPGEDAEVEVESVTVEATGEDITEECQEEAAEVVRERWEDDERDAAEAAAEDAADARRDR